MVLFPKQLAVLLFSVCISCNSGTRASVFQRYFLHLSFCEQKSHIYSSLAKMENKWNVFMLVNSILGFFTYVVLHTKVHFVYKRIFWGGGCGCTSLLCYTLSLIRRPNINSSLYFKKIRKFFLYTYKKII
jgi:hypothetical protein